MGSTHISAAAFDYCQNIAYATSLLDQVIWGVPTSGSPPPAFGQICKSSGGGALLYEPYTRSLLPRIANDSSLESYTVTGSAAAPPVFKSNTNFLRTPGRLQRHGRDCGAHRIARQRRQSACARR